MSEFKPREQIVHAIQLIPNNIPEICDIFLNHPQVKTFNLNLNPELEIPLTLDVTLNTNDPDDWWEITRGDWIVYRKDGAEIIDVYEDKSFRDIFNVEDVT
jgi:hypothetical protein